MSRLSTIGHALYSGEVSVNFVGRRKLWYTVSAAILLVAAAGLGLRGLNLGIEFRGGAEFQVKSTSVTVEKARETAESAGVSEAIVTLIGGDRVRVQTEPLTDAESKQVAAALASAFDVEASEVRVQLVGPSWGGDITKKALQGLGVFIILVMLFLSTYFEWKMAIGAIVALLHDLVITVGVYALIGFEVTPSTVIGLLTILGFSLYDTVVVFDKVKENTRGIAGQSKRTYSDAANLALNQTLVRSVNTTVVALLPVAGILFIGAGVLGAGTLKDLSLALFIGMLAGAYSSIFIATPVLCQLKEREPSMQAVAKRATNRTNPQVQGEGILTAAAAGIPVSKKNATASRRQPKRKH